MIIRLIPVFALLLSTAFSALAAPTQEKKLTGFEEEARLWNQFAKKAHALHKQQLTGRAIRKTEVVERYYGLAAREYSYIETSYYDAKSGLLLSRVRVDRDRPENLHLVEVFIHDQQGRVIRDFSAIYLPWSQHAPMRTMINFHGYNRDVHAYRQFDASGVRVYEQCKGEHSGAPVEISLEDYEIVPTVTASDVYQECFAGVPRKVGSYLSPH